MPALPNLKVALTHDYLKEYGGAEWVVENLHQLFPQAPIFVSYCDYSVVSKYFNNWDIKVSFMQRIPFIVKLGSPLKFLAPKAFESFNLNEFDVVISSSAASYAKAALAGPKALHLAYIHTPPRPLYGLTTAHGYKKHWWTRIGGAILNHFMRIYDFQISQRPDILIANSKNTQARIKKFYRRESVIIYPPVDVESAQKVKAKKENYFIGLSRLDPHKRVDLIIKTFNKLDLPLKVVGTGRQTEELKKLAGKNVEILGEVSEAQKWKLLSGAKALVLAAEDEDFGITAVEAQAVGTPVIASRKGGYLETVIEGKTGEFFDQLSEESLAEKVRSFNPKKYKTGDLKRNAQKFSKERFQKEIFALIEKNLNRS